MDALLLALLAFNPGWPPGDPLLPPDALADPRRMPDDPDFKDACGSFELKSFTSTCALGLPISEAVSGTGIAADRAWLRTVGHPSVTIAVLDLGADFSDLELVSRWALNPAEVPPLDGQHDQNRDGAFTVLDFTSARSSTVPPSLGLVSDPRLLARADRGDANGNGILDPEDVLLVFANHSDDDGNGLVDDVVGYDFVDGDPNPGVRSGGRRARAIAAEANNALAGIGVCPRCTLIPIRVATLERSDGDHVAKGLSLAAKRARIAAVPIPPRTSSAILKASVDECVARGTLVIASTASTGGLETPWVDHGVLFVGTTTPFDPRAPASSFSRPGCATRMIEPGPVAPGDCSGSGSLLVAGVAGLVVSAAPRPIGRAEAYALLRSSTTHPPTAPGVAAVSELGTGRIDARSAVDATSAIPPPVELRSPAELLPVDPFAPFPALVTSIDPGRARALLEIAVARGATPGPELFQTVASSLESSATDRSIRIDVPRPVDPSGPPTVLDDVVVTVRATLSSSIAGTRAEARRAFLVQRDAWTFSAFPISLGASVTAPPRLVDVDGDGRDEILVATNDGILRAIDSDGAPLSGWPHRTDRVRPFVGLSFAHGRALLTSHDGWLFAVDAAGRSADGFPMALGSEARAGPVIGDFDGNGAPDCAVVTSMGVLAFDWMARPLPGFPRPIAEPASAPAVIDLDGDGADELVLATARKVLIMHRSGTRELELESAAIESPRAVGVPLGPPSAPVVADVDGDEELEIALAPLGQRPIVIRDDEPVLMAAGSRTAFGRRAPARRDGPSVVALDGDASLGDLDGDGRPELLHRAAPRETVEGSGVSWEILLGAWDLVDGTFGDQFPRDLRARDTSEPLIADVDGDDRPEVVFEDERLIKAISALGVVPRGFPKVVSDALAGAAFGDLDGDGLLDLVAVTRSGRAFAWRTSGRRAPWPTARHDPSATGTQLEELELPRGRGTSSCSCDGSGDEHNGSGLAILVLIAFCSRRLRTVLASSLMLAGCASIAPLEFSGLDYGYPNERSVSSARAGVEVEIAELGAGPALVLIHPWGTHMGIWSSVAYELAKSSRVILLDLPGHGKSSKPPSRYPVRRMALAVLDVMDALAIERAVVAGNSLGGATAIELARVAPGRVVALGLLAAPGGVPIPEPLLASVRSLARPQSIATLSDLGWTIGWWVLAPGLPSVAESLRDQMLGLRRGSDVHAWARATASALVEVSRYSPPLESITTPAVVIQGTRDIVVWPSSGRELAARLPNGRLVEAKGCGHFLEIECPEIVIGELTKLLKGELWGPFGRPIGKSEGPLPAPRDPRASLVATGPRSVARPPSLLPDKE